LIGGSAKGRNNLNGNSSCRVNGLTICWNDETPKYYRELLVDIEQQNAIEKERVSNSEGKPNIEGRQDLFRFQELTTHDWDNYNQEHKWFVRIDHIPSDTSKIVNSTKLLDFGEEDEELGDSTSWRPFKHFTK